MCVGGWKQLIESSDQMWIALCIYKVYSEMPTDTNLHQTFWIEGNIHQCKFQILWKTFCSVLAIDCGFSWQSEIGLNLITVFGQLQLYDSTLGRWGEALKQSEPNCRTLTHKHLWIYKNILFHVQSEHSPNSFLVYAVSLILIFDYKWSGLLTFLTAVHSLVVFLILCSLWRSKKSEDK